MSCHSAPDRGPREGPQILLVGPPNVGKSVLFGHLTGLHVAVANYAGTTVELARGRGVFGGHEAAILDLPGIYTLSATNEAEQVATEILSRPADLVLVVADALFLEASLYLVQQVIDLNNPVVVILNRIDVARERGIAIDTERLARELGVPVVPTVAVRGEGLALLNQVIAGQLGEPPHRPSTGPGLVAHEPGGGGITDDHRWRRVEEIVRRVELRGDTKTSRWTRLADQLIRPWPGLPVALLVLAVAFGAIIGLGMGARQFLLLPVARGYLFPAIRSGVSALIAPGFFRNILIGEYGFLIKGIEWPFTLVLPYVVSFYLVISILEDSGYLPRLAVLLDGVLSRLGLRGSHTISLLLGYGCAIPGILSARAMGSHKERIILATLISLAVPCISQTGAIFALLAEGALVLVPALFLLSLLVMIVAGAVMDRLLPGTRSQVVFEMPVLLRPQVPVILRKLRGQVVHYLYDGALPMVAAVGVAAVLYETGVLVILARLLAPLVTGWLRLPAEAAVPLVLGVVRRELTVLPLLEMELSTLQLFVGATVGLFYLPCIAVMATLNREFGPRVAVRLLLLTTGVAFLLGGAIAQTGRLVGAL
ncbi:MAG: ferrous iron transporter B [Spirochaetaceae bacterium]|nr:MAG: ferrous iron transporter B [Spirochaetaceae bacterium]